MARVLVRVLVRGLVHRVLVAAVAASLAYLATATALDPRGDLEGRSPRPPQAVIEARLDLLNANDRTPPAERYVVWASGVARGDFGTALDGTPVGAELGRRAAVSLRLVPAGAVLGDVLGVLAAMAGTRGVLRLLSRMGGLAVLAVPVAVLAVCLQVAAQWVNVRSGARIFVWTGEYAPGGTVGPGGGLLDRLRHLVLPVLTIALGRAAVVGHYAGAALREASGAAFARAARARGLSRGRVLTRHVLRVALVAIVPVSAYGTAALLTGAACAEEVFGWHGVGEWLLDSIRRGDVNAVAGCCFLAALVVPLAGLVSDAAVGALDPRLRGGAVR